MRVLVLANRADPEVGFVGESLVARGARLDRAWRDDVDVPLPDPAQHDVVVVLGSEWSVYDPVRAAEVERESAYLAAAVAGDVPVLGICYGSQILAHTLGGQVEAAPDGGEVGWYTVDTDVPDLIPAGPYMQWHTDRFTVPPGGVELARSPIGPQAYVLGPVLAVQFHPEVDVAIATRWAHGGRATLEGRGTDPEALVRETRQHESDARVRADRIVQTFLGGALADPSAVPSSVPAGGRAAGSAGA